MTKIERLIEAQRTLKKCEEWRAMIGSPYRGGGGGIGKIVNVTLSAQVYHQYSDGATNYHAMPSEIASLVAAQLNAAMIDAALEVMRANVQALAAEAVVEHGEMMKAAGLSVA